MRIGILGAARVSPAAVLEPARSVDGVEVAAIASRDPARARAQADRYGVRHAVGDYGELLGLGDLDAVYNPLPISLHHRWALAAIDAGLHLLQEKPFASNAAEAAEIVARGEAAGLVVMEAFHWRYHPLAARVTDLVGRLGRVHHVEAGFDVAIDPTDDVRHSFELSGGALMDLGCYAVQWVRHVARGEPEVVAATMVEGRRHVDVTTTVDLTFPEGTPGRIHTSMDPGVTRRSWIRAEGDGGLLEVEGALDPHRANRLVFTGGARRASVDETVTGDTTYHHQLAAFRDAVVSGTPVPTGGPDAVATMRVIDAAYRAARLPLRGSARAW